jgi:hypothetical protein
VRFTDFINPSYWKQKSFAKQLNNYMKGANSTMEFIPSATRGIINTSVLFTRRMRENSVLYGGNENAIRYFYSTEAKQYKYHTFTSDGENYFWKNAGPEDRKIHSGLPQLISEKMVDIIAGNGFSIKIKSIDGNEVIPKDESDMLTAVLKDNNIGELLQKSIETESWSGGTAWKLSLDTSISIYPIIEVVEPEEYSYIEKRGRIVADIFTKFYKHLDRKFRLREIYGVDDEGSFINYTLEVFNDEAGKEEWIAVSLETIPETAGLKTLKLKGYFEKLSLYKPNKTPNSEFRGTKYGESDYAGSYGLFDGLDEILSTHLEEYRNSGLDVYIPSKYAEQSPEGEVFAKKLKKRHITYDSSLAEGTVEKIQYGQGDLRTEKHTESFNQVRDEILNNSGIAPSTIGAVSQESIDASAESQQEREKTTIRTRNKKIKLWMPFLNKIIGVLMTINDMKDTIVDGMNIDPETMEEVTGTFKVYDIATVFEDYIIKSKKDRTGEVSENGVVAWSVKKAVEYVHEELSPTDVEKMVAEIREDNIITEASKNVGA